MGARDPRHCPQSSNFQIVGKLKQSVDFHVMQMNYWREEYGVASALFKLTIGDFLSSKFEKHIPSQIVSKIRQSTRA